MAIIFFFLSIFVLILVGVSKLIDTIKGQIQVRKYSKQAKEKVSEFHTLCTPTRFFSIAELNAFKDSSKNLYECTRSLSIDSSLMKKSGIDEFIETYSIIDREQRHNNNLYGRISTVNQHLNFAFDIWSAMITDSNKYIAQSEIEQYKRHYHELKKAIEYCIKNDIVEYLDDPHVAYKLLDIWKEIDTSKKQHNDQFKQEQLLLHKAYFDTVLSYPLDNQQREAIVTLEDNCLVISSAGSGKTCTMVGKIEYLVQKRNIPSNKILVITYTQKAAQELASRIDNDQITCVTFHKLALEIITAITGAKPSIAPSDLLLSCFYNMLRDKAFIQSMVQYVTEFQSGVKDMFEYQTSAEYYADRKKYGRQSLFLDMDDKIVFTKSEEEKKICSILASLDIKFRYEEPYEYITRTPDYRQYKPDFSIHYLDNNGKPKRIYLEHFAINGQGTVPMWFGEDYPGGWAAANKHYNDGIRWKKNLHLIKGTNLIFTTSADFQSGVARDKLISLLKACGVPMREVPAEELYKRIVSRSKSIEKSLIQICESFITLMKANKKSINELLNKAIDDKSERNVAIISHIMRPLFEHYETALVSRGEIDFTDAIIKATDLCNNGLWTNYEYILVDEFQDISVDRYLFLKSLRTQSPLTKLFCVGDDWQSIYRFTGSDMALFTEFDKYFGFTEECKIETTYRFGNPLIDKSSEFVQKNPCQKQKEIKPSRAANTELDFVQYDNDDTLYDTLKRLIDQIPSDKSIYILGRYTFDADYLNRGNGKARVIFDEKREKITVKISGRSIPFLTVHSSKGLEADYVFLIRCNNGINGFPSMISDDPVLDYVLSESDHYEYGEERRLFYVGITRAKEHTFVLYQNDKPSPFVTEINGLSLAPDEELCPICKDGHKIVIKRGTAVNGNEYINWGCSNHAAGCRFHETKWINYN